MNEQKTKGRGMFYGVIGVATLVVAIIGATFAYFTATATNGANVITGNMATITFDLSVAKVTHVDETKGGMIPMSNNMVQAAVTSRTESPAKSTCVDDNGNAVCQVYKITVENTGSASLFLDGYVTLTGGSGDATDIGAANGGANVSGIVNPTTMRWAQVFCTGTETDEITGCTTAGDTTTGATGVSSFTVLGDSADTTGFDADRIKTTYASVIGTGTISGNSYDVINNNFIRISNHDAENSYDRQDDVTSALVYNQFLDPASATLESDEVTYYIVVWLSETGTNQTADAVISGEGAEAVRNPAALGFFNGSVTFNSAQGSEVTATFSSYHAVPSDQASSASQNDSGQS